MRRIATALCLLLAVPVLADTAPLRLVGGKPTVSVRINGSGPYDFYLDTGAGVTVINHDLAKELKLPEKGTTRVGDPANPTAIEARKVAVAEVELGGMTFRDVEALTWDRSELYTAGAPRGVLGMPLFAELILTLDLGNETVGLSRGRIEDGPGVVRYDDREGGVFRVPLTLGDRKVEAVMDSGSAGGLTLPRRQAEGLPLAGTLTEVGRGRTVNSEFTVYGATVNAPLRIAGTSLEKPYVQFQDVLPVAHFGNAILRQFVVSIDQKSQRIRFEPAKVKAAAPPTTRTAGYAGRYGIRSVLAEGDQLFLQRDGGPKLRLVAAENDEFTIEGVPAGRVRFRRDAAGKVTAMDVLNREGQWESAARSAS